MRSFTLKLAPIIVCVLFFIPAVPAAHAAGLTEAQKQAILGLLASFGADASVIANVTASLGGVSGSVPTPSSNSGACVTLTYTLSQGSSDTMTYGEVTKLQNFLGISSANGYFGPATLKALQNWQSSHGVATAGVTGYGVAGPKTRAAMSCK